jgi:hypothetical protein
MIGLQLWFLEFVLLQGEGAQHRIRDFADVPSLNRRSSVRRSLTVHGERQGEGRVGASFFRACIGRCILRGDSQANNCEDELRCT